MKKADWVKYRESEAWKHLYMNRSSTSNEEILLEFYARIDRVAEESIPKIVKGKFMPMPFWSDRLRQTPDIGKSQYKKYNRINSVQNYILWKRQRRSTGS